MENKKYMNFDEAVEFLSTTRSTLYKWMQADKVPGHKLGRQWRFLESELIEFSSGTNEKYKLQESIQQFLKFLNSRNKNNKGNKMSKTIEENTCEIAEQLIWDATNAGAQGIHIQPKAGKYEISYRCIRDMETLTQIDTPTFNAINTYYQDVSSPTKDENKRRFFLGKKVGEGNINLHIRYQQMETVSGTRIHMKIDRSDHVANSLKVIAKDNDLATLQRWCTSSHGIVVFTGATGSGKGTSVHCALRDIIKDERVVFTIEDPVEFILEGANQIEVDTSDTKAFQSAYDAIYDSDLDVLGLGVSFNVNSENLIHQAAFQAASTGHLVILMMHESSVDQALEKLKENIGDKVEDLIIGISCQKLRKQLKGNGRFAQYELASGAMDFPKKN